MAEYQLTEIDIVIRTADRAFIPNDKANRDRVEYDAWVAAGGKPDPYVPPPGTPRTGKVPTAQPVKGAKLKLK